MLEEKREKAKKAASGEGPKKPKATAAKRPEVGTVNVLASRVTNSCLAPLRILLSGTIKSFEHCCKILSCGVD